MIYIYIYYDIYSMIYVYIYIYDIFNIFQDILKIKRPTIQIIGLRGADIAFILVSAVHYFLGSMSIYTISDAPKSMAFSGT